MNLSDKEKLHVLRILKEEGVEECVTLERLIKGKLDAVAKGGRTRLEQGQDKVEGTREEIEKFWGFLASHSPPFIRPVPQNKPVCHELTQAGEEYYEQLKTSGVGSLD